MNASTAQLETAVGPPSVGAPAPPLSLECIDAFSGKPYTVRLDDYRGKWLILIFYPRDFSFVCPTELTRFSERMEDFRRQNCALLGISVDSIELHREWLATPSSQDGVEDLQFPLASDPSGGVSRAYGIWNAQKGVSNRGLFIVDPEGVLQYMVTHNLSVGRNAEEILRVLHALQTGGLCPANWTADDGTIDPERALVPGRTLGHYRIRRRIGSGTFGSVFSAWDLQLERMVALKVLRRRAAESRQALVSEARVAARLNHPNICTIYTVDEEDGLPLIVMEFIDGRVLSQSIADGLTGKQVDRLAAGIAEGLVAAHQEAVVHGDLKPANIMVTPSGTPKILDFSLAAARRAPRPLRAEKAPGASGERAEVRGDPRVEETASWSAGSGSDALQGTPAYMSPEQLAGQPATPASDVFAFGLVWFEMLTGRRALAEPTLSKLLVRMDRGNLAEELAPQVPGRWRAALATALAHDPALRPTMKQLLRLLA